MPSFSKNSLIYVITVAIFGCHNKPATCNKQETQTEIEDDQSQLVEFHYIDKNDLRTKIDQIEQKLSYVVKHVAQMSEKLDQFNVDLPFFKRQADSMNSRHVAFANRLAYMEKRCDNLQAQERVAFSAYHENSQRYKITDDIVHFSGVEYNHGDGYDEATSVFTCPLSGVYFFIVTLKTPGVLKMDGRDLAHITLYTDNNKKFIKAPRTNSIVVECILGSKVWVEKTGNENWGLYPERGTTFNGFLLYTLD